MHARDQKTRLATLEIVACRASTVAAPRDCILRFGRSTSEDKKEENIFAYPLKDVKNTRNQSSNGRRSWSLWRSERRRSTRCSRRVQGEREREEGLVRRGCLAGKAGTPTRNNKRIRKKRSDLKKQRERVKSDRGGMDRRLEV